MARKISAKTLGGRADRRAQITSEAANLFDRSGYANTSMDEIAAKVGIAKPTLYHYYASKDEILYELHEEFLDRLIISHSRRLLIENSPSKLLQGVMIDILQLMETHRGHVRVFFEHHRELSEPRRNAMRKKRHNFNAMIVDIIRKGISSGEIAEVDPDLLALAIFGMCNWSYQWFHTKLPWSAEQIARQYWTMLFHGVEKGHFPAGLGRASAL